jgi:ElaB/YqjD/DUF883 family membrane-anchored ribosome-binding protein
MAVSARKRTTASQKRRRQSAPSTQRRRRRRPVTPGALARTQSVLSGAVAGDATALQQEVGRLVRDLEDRLDRLNGLTKRGASHAVEGVNNLVYGTLSDMTERVRERAENVSNDVASMGNRALGRVAREIDQRPLLTIAIAAGIGFLAGMARRSD